MDVASQSVVLPMNAQLEGSEPTAGGARTRIGQVLGDKWTIDQLLGAGGTGEVYAARHQNGHRVAIKVALAQWGRYPQVRQRFLVEARAANRVEHRAVARIHDEGAAEDGSIFLVMDLLRGQTLAEYLEWNGLLSPEQALLVAHEVLEALIVAHEAGVIHRDIKPGNLFVNCDGRVLLLDFGIARLPEQSFLTEAGVPIGTPSFMPPEQAAGRWHEVDGRSDLWSLGATLFTLLSGQPVRRARSVLEELEVAALRKARSLGSVRELPSRVVELVDTALAHDPADRFESATAMRDAVRRVMTELGIALPRASELPGVRAGLIAADSNQVVESDPHPSAIRLRLCELTLPVPEVPRSEAPAAESETSAAESQPPKAESLPLAAKAQSPSEPELEFSVHLVRPPRRVLRSLVVPLALGALALTLLQPEYAAARFESLARGLGMTESPRASGGLRSAASAIVRDFESNATLAAGAERVQAVLELATEWSDRLPQLESLPEPEKPRVPASRRARASADTPPPPFDPLAARL